jgi:hypothetical protein
LHICSAPGVNMRAAQEPSVGMLCNAMIFLCALTSAQPLFTRVCIAVNSCMSAASSSRVCNLCVLFKCASPCASVLLGIVLEAPGLPACSVPGVVMCQHNMTS